MGFPSAQPFSRHVYSSTFSKPSRLARAISTTSWGILSLSQRRGPPKSGGAATAGKYQYLWDPRYIDAPICRDEDTSDGQGGDPDGDCVDSDDEHLYYCQDANFNTTALVDDDGTVVERYVYDPYGKVTIYNEGRTSTVDWEDSKQNEILFCGYRHDPETGLYHVRHRMYHPTLGRWLQRDPLGYVDGMSLYEYAVSAPTVALDPLGAVAIVKGRQQGQSPLDSEADTGVTRRPDQVRRDKRQ